MKFLDKINKKEKKSFKVPHSVQNCIPVERIYRDGIFYLGNSEYSKAYKFTDTNYAVANKEDKEDMFLKYCELLNSLDSGALNKIIIMNRKLNKGDFEKLKLNSKIEDSLKVYRDEYNKMLLDKAEYSNRMVQEKYILTTVEKKNVADARTYFSRISTELSTHLSELNSKCIEQGLNDRLRLLYDFYRNTDGDDFNYDFLSSIRRGHDFKDYICPDGMSIKNNYIKIGNRYARVLFLREYATFIKDSMVTELTDLNKNMILTIDALSVPMDEAVREAENRRLGIETNITNWQRRQNNNNK